MDGIIYLQDKESKKNFVQIDLERYGDLWPDFLDVIIAHSRKNDKKITLDEVKKQILMNEV